MIKSTWRSPSNIALVKYWGKKGPQIPSNPSISFTLSNCYTETSVTLLEKSTKQEFDLEVHVDGIRNENFEPKILQFFKKVQGQFQFLLDHKIKIETSNTFPHSSGIASSASGFSALALCLHSIAEQLAYSNSELDLKMVSSTARIGSGSACRSVSGGLMVWGEHSSFEGSDDHYAVAYDDVHPVFRDYQDTILLVHKGQKSVSSTVGHGLIKNHPFAEARFEKANENMHTLKNYLKNGDLEGFVALVESEALTLHALMMSSMPSFVLMKPNTLAIIEEIQSFREQTGVQVCFTLDAGANVHMLFPKQNKELINKLVDEKLKQYCENDAYICDEVGSGPIKLN